MPEAYFCKVQKGQQLPAYIRLSANKTCEPSSLSTPIPVWNRDVLATPPEGVGVCIHGCAYTLDGSSEKAYKNIIQFLAMAKVLGAEVVTLYNLNINQSLLKQVSRVYPDFLDIVQWMNLNNTLHYYGQRILINDCLYRNMKRVKYVAMIDTDEMILPVSNNSWPEMLNTLEKEGKYASYTFSNNFFEEVKGREGGGGIEACPKRWGIPKYFSRLNRLPWPQYKQNTKMKMILRTDAISATCIHDVCRTTTQGYTRTYRVPYSVGFMAHYREPVQREYVFGNGTEDRTALWFQAEVEAEMRKKCVMLANRVT